MKHCPICDGEGVYLGALGRMKHYRCRACGWTFGRLSRPRKPKD